MMSRQAPIAAGTLACLLAFSAPAAAATTLDAAVRSSQFTIASQVLGEPRAVHVRVPPGFDPGRRYPVVYVLDAEWNFEFVAAYLDNLVANEVYPPLIVSGIVNVDRNRDYVPRADAHFPHTGQADAFLRFVEEEWIAQVEERFPASAQRVLVGHSFGGVFTLHALFRRPELFDAYLAMGTSAWIGERVLFEEAHALFASGAEPDAFVWMAVGEGDGGPTLPSGRDLAALFETEAPSSLEWTFSVTPRTDHFTNFISGVHEAFEALFPAWGFPDALEARARAGGAPAVRAWFAEQEQALGWRFQPAWFDLGVKALVLSREPEHAGAAQALAEELRRHYPRQVHVAQFSANVHANAGDLEQALAEIERTIALTREAGLHPNEVQLESLEANRARILERLAAKAER